jgi:hypothetical protein
MTFDADSRALIGLFECSDVPTFPFTTFGAISGSVLFVGGEIAPICPEADFCTACGRPLCGMCSLMRETKPI